VLPLTILVICMILYTMGKEEKGGGGEGKKKIGGLLAWLLNRHALQPFLPGWESSRSAA